MRLEEFRKNILRRSMAWKKKESKESHGENPEYIADVREEKNNYYIDKISCVKVILNM